MGGGGGGVEGGWSLVVRNQKPKLDSIFLSKVLSSSFWVVNRLLVGIVDSRLRDIWIDDTKC